MLRRLAPRLERTVIAGQARTDVESVSAATEPGSAREPRTPAQWYGYIVGAALLLAGVLGFTADATFDVAGTDANPAAGLQGDGFLGLEVNGTHNVVHLVSGLVLLLMASRRDRARTAAIAFGSVYALVTLAGLIDGSTVIGLIPVNPADNVLHAVLAGAGLVAGLVSEEGREARAPAHEGR